MRKNSIISLFAGLFFTFISAEAQIEIDQNGKVGIGDSPNQSYDLNIKDSVIFDTFGRWDYPTGSAYYHERDILIHHTFLFSDPYTSTWDPSIFPAVSHTCAIGTPSKPWGHIYGDGIHYYSLYNQSDASLKENISSLKSGSLKRILQLRAVKFDYKKEAIGISLEFDEYNPLNYMLKNRTGFIAQEVKKILPELVLDDNGTGKMAINYVELIPILVEAMKEQQTIIEQYEERLSELELAQSSALKRLSTGVEDFTSSGAQLFQNNPNPFSENTIIKYTLPATARAAYINIYDMAGKQVMSQSIATNITESQISIAGGEFDAGMYMYSLMVDNKLVDTKQMILTNNN